MDIKVGEYIERNDSDVKVKMFVTKILDSGVKGIMKDDPEGNEVFIPNSALELKWKPSPKVTPEEKVTKEPYYIVVMDYCLNEVRKFTLKCEPEDGEQWLEDSDPNWKSSQCYWMGSKTPITIKEAVMKQLNSNNLITREELSEVRGSFVKLPDTSEFTVYDWDIIYRSLKDHYSNHVGLRDPERKDTETLIKVLEEAGFKEN